MLLPFSMKGQSPYNNHHHHTKHKAGGYDPSVEEALRCLFISIHVDELESWCDCACVILPEVNFIQFNLITRRITPESERVIFIMSVRREWARPKLVGVGREYSSA